MDLFLQMGHGMMGHAKELIKKWHGGTVILSPRDMTLLQMEKFSKEIKKNGGEILIDPQFYIPRADHEKLINHPFWPNEFETNAFFSGDGLRGMIQTLWNDYNNRVGAKYFLLPGIFSSAINDDWKILNDIFIEEGVRISPEVHSLATLCLSSGILRSEDQIHEIIDHVESWNVIGFYIVPQHPGNSYLVEDPVWLANLLDLCAGLKNMNKKVIVGYSNHQLLCLATAKVDAIASGTWVNVRMFPLSKFSKPDDDSFSKRTTWYYCPQSLSEYQIRFLDVAKNVGILNKLKADGSFLSEYADILFKGAQPTSVKFSEREAFRHYLQCLKIHTSQAARGSFSETLNGLFMQLEAAGQLLKWFRAKGVRGSYRDFSEVLDINISALDQFKASRGFMFSKKWNNIK